MSKKLLPHLVFWPGLVLIVALCLCLLPSPLFRPYTLGFISIWGGLSGFLGLCPIPLTARYTDDFGKKPLYLLFVLLGGLEIYFRLRTTAFLLLDGTVAVLIRLFDKE